MIVLVYWHTIRLPFIKRNLKDCPQKLKEIVYFSLVRSFVDYASTVWDPHQKFNQEKLEMVQRRAARFVKIRYRRTDSVTAMLDNWVGLFYQKGARTPNSFFFTKLLTTWHKYIGVILNLETCQLTIRIS